MSGFSSRLSAPSGAAGRSRRLSRGHVFYTALAALGLALVGLLEWTHDSIGAISTQENSASFVSFESHTLSADEIKESEMQRAVPLYALPVPLSEQDAEHYRQAFRLLDKGDWMAAWYTAGRASDPLLIGTLLGEKYLHPRYRTSFEELEHWLHYYGDHPQLQALRGLAEKRAPETEKKAKNYLFQTKSEPHQEYIRGYGSHSGRSGSIRRLYRDMLNWERRPTAHKHWNRLMHRIDQERLTSAYEYLRQKEVKLHLSPHEYDMIRWYIADGYLRFMMDNDAYRLASQAALRSGSLLPEIHWTAGLAAWRLKKYDKAAEHFAVLARAPHISQWDNAAGAFWGHRAYEKLNKKDDSERMLKRAAQFPRTFYGILALEVTGQEIVLDTHDPVLTEGVLMPLLETAPMKRALALRQIGRDRLAEKELRRLFAVSDVSQKETLLALARQWGLYTATIPMGYYLGQETGRYYDMAMYPLPGWAEEKQKEPNAFLLDPAMVWALTRQESGFHTAAVSRSGARGLMQLMPATARYISKKRGLGLTDMRQLFQPAYNMQLGQHYVDYLRTKDYLADNIMLLFAAYNGGPGNVRNWLARYPYRDDPLMFMESIPLPETRDYVGQVMANYWVYQARLGRKDATLSQLAAGYWPQYEWAGALPDNASQYAEK